MIKSSLQVTKYILYSILLLPLPPVGVACCAGGDECGGHSSAGTTTKSLPDHPSTETNLSSGHLPHARSPKVCLHSTPSFTSPPPPHTYTTHTHRVLRQIFQCIRPILDVILLLILSLVVFSLLGQSLSHTLSQCLTNTHTHSHTYRLSYLC